MSECVYAELDGKEYGEDFVHDLEAWHWVRNLRFCSVDYEVLQAMLE